MCASKTDLELYIHIPFCIKKCNYCDFLSFPSNEERREIYVQSLINEIEQTGKLLDKDAYAVRSIFIGGGTPSLLSGKQIERIMLAVRNAFFIMEEAEITMETNPGTLTKENVFSYKKAGVNRFSMGLQSADDACLHLLGRIHTWEEFLKSYELARKAGFENINVDLMSALPGQDLHSWKTTLRKVLMLKPEHISAYSLIIEEQTPFYEKYHADDERRAKGECPQYLPSEEEEREMYEDTELLLSEAGLYRYEISNYAKPGFACSHNIGYWTGVEYAGFGLGASSLISHVRYKNTEDMQCYLQAYGTGTAEAAGQVCSQEALTVQDEMEEFMFLGLRMMQGVREQEFARRFGQSVEAVYGSVLPRLLKEGLLIRDNGSIRLTRQGVSLSNYVMSEFIL